MNKYSYKIEISTKKDLTEKEEEAFLVYIKYKLDNISILPKEVEKKISKIIESDDNIEILIKKFKLEDEI